nr:reverse transcriptase domain-containing protein [Tanacetum cinerariifolium]
MSTRSSGRRLLSPIEDPVRLLSRRNRSEPSLLIDLEEDDMAGQVPLQGPIPDLRSWKSYSRHLSMIDTFYNSLNQSDQDSFNFAAGGNFLTKNTQEALTIIENKYKVQTSRNKPQVSSASGSSTQDTAITALTKQVEALVSSMNQPINLIQNGCETCGGPHAYYECQAVAGYTQDVFEKHGDPGKFLIPCDFPELEKCMALDDLGASINIMPLFVWKKLRLPKLIPTRMTLELANRSLAYPTGIAEDVCVQVGRRVLLVDVYGDELILRDGDEKLIFHADSTLKHPHKHGNESINMINFIHITCEDRFPKVLKIKKSNHPSSGSTTSLFDSFPSLTLFKTSNSLLEEFANELTLLDPFTPGNKDDNFDPEADLREIEYLLNRDLSTDSPPKTNLLTSELTLLEESSEIATLLSSPFENEDKVFSPGILILGGTQIFNYESQDKDFKVNTSFEALLILEERNFLSISSDRELLFYLELTVIKTLLSFSSENKDKVFNPVILTSKGVHSLTLELSHWTYATFKIVNVHLNILNEDYDAEGRLRKISVEKAWATIEELARYEDEGWNDPVIMGEGSLDCENPDIEQLLWVMKFFSSPPLVRESTFGFKPGTNNDQNIKSRHDAKNLSPQSSPQLPPSFKVYTPPVTYPNEVEETLGTPIEVEPLDEAPLEDLGLNTCNHEIPLSSKEIPNFYESEPQPQPLPSCPSLNINLGEESGLEPPIKPPSPDSFRMKEVDHLTNHTPPLPRVVSFHLRNLYCYYCPCVDDPKKHYGFKPGLLGQSGSLGVDFLNMEMREDDWELEPIEVSFLERRLNFPVRPKEVENVRINETHHRSTSFFYLFSFPFICFNGYF